MKIKRIIELLEIEKECVLRNASGECNRACHICDLLQDDTELHEMYAEVIARMKAQTSCEDAVGREAVNDAIARSAHWADMKDRIAALPSVKPVPLARVMSLEEVKELHPGDDVHIERISSITGVHYIYATTIWRVFSKSIKLSPDNATLWFSEYGETWRCWTSRPTDEQREAVKWE